MVRMPLSMEAELRRVAAEQPIPVQPSELLRWAAEAIIDCHKLYKRVPRDLAVSQKPWVQKEPSDLMAAEDEGNPPPSKKTKSA